MGHEPEPMPKHCGSYHPGHDPHWIQVFRSEENRATRQSVRVTAVEGARVAVLLDGGEEHYWTHDTDYLQARLGGRDRLGGPDDLGRRATVAVHERWSLLLVEPATGGTYVFSVAHRPSPCPEEP
jgi:hypothetical protein